MCNKKVRLITAVIITSSVLMFSGCGKNDSTTEPVISDAVEETEPIEEENGTEEIEESEDTASEVGDTEENDASDNDSDNGISGTGYDSKTDEEIEAELEETYGEVPSSSAGMYDFSLDADPSLYDENGINKETGQYNRFMDQDDNNGQGWDYNDKHFETRGEYNRYVNEIMQNDPDVMSQEEWEAFKEGIKSSTGYMVEQ